MKAHKLAERAVKRAIEDRGFVVHDANLLIDANCPNIDLVAFGKKSAKYVQVKLSSKPATKEGTVVDGSPWDEDQLFKGAPVFNKHSDGLQAHLIVIAHQGPSGEFTFYVVPPKPLLAIMLPVARAFAKKPKRDGSQRKMFRKEIPLAKLARYREAWRYLGEPLGPRSDASQP
jgi:hypothetical protein